MYGQNVGIGKVPSPFAKLEVWDTTRGILIPRLTVKQRNLHLNNPDTALLIYNKDCHVFQYWDGNQWVTLLPATKAMTASSWCSALANWQYRVPITISNASAVTMTDIQVLVTVNTQVLVAAGKMQSTGADIRFTDNACNPLNFYIESGMNTATTRIWVRVPQIPANGSTTIYMYYGEPNANSASNPGATFHWWDDFTNLANWTPAPGTNFTLTGGVLRVNVGYLYMNAPLPVILNNGFVLEARMRFYPVSTGNSYSGNLEANSAQQGGCGSNSCGNAVIHYMREVGSQTIRWWAGNGATNSYNIGSANCWVSANNTWYIFGYKILPNRIHFYRDYALQCSSPAFGGWAKNLQWIILGHFCCIMDGQDTDYDWVRVRRAYATDPVASPGAEETNPCL